MEKEKLALFLGMLCGDGCLNTKTKKRGWKTYSTEFYNTDIKLMQLFDGLFYDLFKIRGHFYPRKRKERRIIYEFRSYSRDIFDSISSKGFPMGVKKDALTIPKPIKKGSEKEKLNFFMGFLMTDGCIRKNKTIIFHIGSKKFLQELSMLVNELFGIKREIREYVQKGKYHSYQLNLNKKESEVILSTLPPWHNGTASVLS
ncbi:hypothetical protein A3K73_07700 [Candidatus Pacearchaeota archaeon RBG_13_36_9]|nr:MAG: hypothetical protein A3K73_07700 [Candidatus Pacearchaeota archaeon RBG_13_36_9]